MNSRPQRIHDNLAKALISVIPERLRRYPEEVNDLTFAELTRMLVNTDGFQQSLKELKEKPRITNVQ